MEKLFADRITDVPRSFIREILKDALVPGTISFAGGLPNRDLFPGKAIKAATDKVFERYGNDLFQYSNSEGLRELREFIANRYQQQQGLNIDPDDILITSGSQQGLDLLGKTLLNDGDGLIVEEPGYLGAIQAFSIYRPTFLPITVSELGMDTDKLVSCLTSNKPKLFYTVPNFQNPSGITYPKNNREAIAKLIEGTSTLLIEDNPYGDLRFEGEHLPSFANYLPKNTVLLGSFSKTIVPGFRIGWITGPKPLMEKLLIAKQASDLHTNQLSQCIILQYLQDNDLDQHIQAIITAYGSQKNCMIEAIKQHFPDSVSYTNPEGGMFLWATLPEGQSALKLFEQAAKEKVIFVPGDPFYIGRKNVNTLRLNFSCTDIATTQKGIERLGEAITVGGL